MLRNEITTALRNITRHKIHAAVNIAGLSMGMAATVLILFWVWGEISYDRYHIRADRIFRMVSAFQGSGMEPQTYAKTPAPYGPAIRDQYEEVEEAVRLYPRRMFAQSQNARAFEEIIFADPSLLNVFTFKVLHGNPSTALQNPGSVVLTRSAAMKYFGHGSPLNQVIQLECRKTGNRPYAVTAIIEDIPKNSHYYTNMFVSMSTLKTVSYYIEKHFGSWIYHGMYTYLLIKENTKSEQLEEKFVNFNRRNIIPHLVDDTDLSITIHLQNLKRIHLHSHLQEEIRSNGNIKNVLIFSAVAFFILLLACINYMNLATAQTITRAKEVGIRKAVGASPRQLIKQFFIEAFIFTFIALVFTILLIELSMPLYHAITGENLGYSVYMNWKILGGLVFILLFVGFVSGSYPAYILSRTNPASILRGLLSFGIEKINIRRSLVLLQFCIAIGLIIVTLVMTEQVSLLKNRTGFDTKNLLVIPINTEWMKLNHETVKEALSQNTNILNASVMSGIPGGSTAVDEIRILSENQSTLYTTKMIYADHDYLRTTGLSLVSGRDFSKSTPSDATEAFILNESAVREFNLSQPLGTPILWGDEWHETQKKGRIIGVVKDFQYQSLKTSIAPLVIHIKPYFTRLFVLRIAPDDIPNTISFIRQTWEKYDPAYPFEYEYLEDKFNRQYRSEASLSRVLLYLSILAITIASMGLLGLTAFLVQQRTKEIGMRKVLGASFMDIISILIREFTKWIILANLLAWPIAFIILRQWLIEYAYYIDLRITTFLLAGLIVVAIALTTIFLQASRIAYSNPTENLRYE